MRLRDLTNLSEHIYIRRQSINLCFSEPRESNTEIYLFY